MSYTNNRALQQVVGDNVGDPVAAGAKIQAGDIVALNASGLLVPITEDASLKPRGRAEASYDNTGGSGGAGVIEVLRGAFRLNNDNVNPVDRSHIGGSAWAIDGRTVSSGSTGRSVMGKVINIEGDFVFVEIGNP